MRIKARKEAFERWLFEQEDGSIRLPTDPVFRWRVNVVAASVSATFVALLLVLMLLVKR